MQSLYVYYRVRPANAKTVRVLIRQMQAQLANRTGVRPKMLLRVEQTAEGTETWMEIYENVQSDFIVRLTEAVNAVGVQDWIEGPRKVEIFVPIH